jgi:hypothetical protein
MDNAFCHGQLLRLRYIAEALAPHFPKNAKESNYLQEKSVEISINTSKKIMFSSFCTNNMVENSTVIVIHSRGSGNFCSLII